MIKRCFIVLALSALISCKTKSRAIIRYENGCATFTPDSSYKGSPDFKTAYLVNMTGEQLYATLEWTNTYFNEGHRVKIDTTVEKLDSAAVVNIGCTFIDRWEQKARIIDVSKDIPLWYEQKIMRLLQERTKGR